MTDDEQTMDTMMNVVTGELKNSFPDIHFESSPGAWFNAIPASANLYKTLIGDEGDCRIHSWNIVYRDNSLVYYFVLYGYQWLPGIDRRTELGGLEISYSDPDLIPKLRQLIKDDWAKLEHQAV